MLLKLVKFDMKRVCTRVGAGAGAGEGGPDKSIATHVNRLQFMSPASITASHLHWKLSGPGPRLLGTSI